MSVRSGMLAVAIAAVSMEPVTASDQHASAAGPETELVNASGSLFECFSRFQVKGQARGWSELAYYQAIRIGCMSETAAFTEANLQAAAHDGPAGRQAALRRTRQALAGVLVDAALSYERTGAYGEGRP